MVYGLISGKLIARAGKGDTEKPDGTDTMWGAARAASLGTWQVGVQQFVLVSEVDVMDYSMEWCSCGCAEPSFTVVLAPAAFPPAAAPSRCGRAPLGTWE